MMGGYCYYDDQAHDCMWSGECCQSTTTVIATHSSLTYLHLDVQSSSATSAASSTTSCSTTSTSKSSSSGSSSSKCSTKSTASSASSSASTSSSRSTVTALSVSQRQSPIPSAEHKKLRHREVEKNRHRQLQAMVRRLSQTVPGGTQKETQVQTMKRAARYCIYLRKLLSSSNITWITNANTKQLPGSCQMKDKLNEIYQQSCESVDDIMSAK